MKGQRGMTLVELMVSLAIVLLVIAASTLAYLKIFTTYKTQGAMSENLMQNLTGFELLRHDIEMAGYGLPRNIPSVITYTEALPIGSYTSAQNTASFSPPYDPSTLNEGCPTFLNNANLPPHPLVLNPNNADQTQTTISGNTPTVLAIKSSVAWINIASSHSGLYVNSLTENGGTLAPGDHFIMLDPAGNLVPTSSNSWDFSLNSSSVIQPTGAPSNLFVYFMYGLSTSATTRAPFNRVDYYLSPAKANLPAYCAPGTFELYRSVVSQTDGTLQAAPLIDCVEDFQVAFGIDPSGAGTKPIVWQADMGDENIGGSQSTIMNTSLMQQYLREVKVFVVYQEGRGKVTTTPDFSFSGPPLELGDQVTGPSNPNNINLNPLGGNSFTPSGVYSQYRWRVQEIDVKLMNVLNNTW